MKWTAVALLVALPLAANHTQSATFDTNKLVIMKGVVTDVEWQNPHVFLHMDFQGVAWRISIASPGSLKRQGVTKDSFKQGETTIEAFLAKDGSRVADGKEGGTLTLPNGRKVAIPCCWVADPGKAIVFGPSAKK